ncbi:MAG: penicillin-binding transpeptidase domain-containing protein, partial [Dehalococcoidia bacterium]
DSPLLNRATQGLYTPGSTFKTVTLIAAVEAGLDGNAPATCAEQVFIDGVSITSQNEPPGKTTQTVADAYGYSCNTFFAELGLEVGEEQFTRTARALGLDEDVPFALPTSEGRLASTRGFLDTDAGLAASAFGQGELQFTPLHLALVTAAVANEGVVMRPRLFLHEDPSEWRTAMSPATAREVASMMEYGVQAGWASTAAIPGVRVAGKTGSAEVAEGESSHALFIAFAPVEAPTIAVAVVKEFAGAGSREAGPVAKAVIEAWLAQDRPTTAR